MIVGLRPEHFSDARIGGGGAELPVTVEITGSSAPRPSSTSASRAWSAPNRSVSRRPRSGGAFVARLDPRTHPGAGEQLQLA